MSDNIPQLDNTIGAGSNNPENTTQAHTFSEDFYKGPIALFASHRVAANLLMILMLIFGLFSLGKLSRQMFPSFDFEWVVVSTPWIGASPEDVESSITLPLEREVKNIDGLKELTSFSISGASLIYLEMNDGVDINKVLSDVKQKVDAVYSLPADAKEPIVTNLSANSHVMNLLVYTEGPREELLPIVREIEAGLLAGGIGDIKFDALPEEDIVVQVDKNTLQSLNMSLQQIGEKIASNNIDLPAGTAGRNEGGRVVRVANQRKTAALLSELPVINNGDSLLTVGDIAIVRKKLDDDVDYITYKGHHAVVMKLFGLPGQDVIDLAGDVDEWLNDYRTQTPDSIHIVPHLQKWLLIKDRLYTLVNNAGTGLIFIVLILFLFLNMRVAFWVAMGVPIALLATMGLLYAFGGSLNLISLLGLLVALGIVVDDAIVVGEESLAHFQNGVPARESAILGARKMFIPVMASSMTTVAAFIPTAMFSGAMGKIIFDIPFIIICILIASIVECFLILPGHLHHSLKKVKKEPSRFRKWFDNGFERFKEGFFIPILKACLNFRWTTVFAAMMILVLSVTTLTTGFLKWNFFPGADTSDLRASFKFFAGASEQDSDAFLAHLEQTLQETNQELGGDIVQFSYQQHKIVAGFESLGGSVNSFDAGFGTLVVETYVGDNRTIDNDAFIAAWRKRIHVPSGIDSFSIEKSAVGPPGKDLEFYLIHKDISTLKKAALDLQETMRAYSGVFNVGDNMPWGGEQYILHLNTQGLASGLTLANLSAQVRAALDGVLIQELNVGAEKIDVRVILPDGERRDLSQFDSLPILLPTGKMVALQEVADVTIHKGFQSLPRKNAVRSIKVQADVDKSINNATSIFTDMKINVFPELKSKYGVDFKPAGSLKDDVQAKQDMMKGVVIAFIMMFIILAWVFSSYTWPLVVMSAIFLGLSGAILGHIIVIRTGFLAIEFSFLSAIGMFGLAGIIVNDSIILASFVQDKLALGVKPYTAVVDACRQRLRPVLLTSITTIVGMTPILFETSVQAQFLKPMVVSLIFGLFFGTILILVVVPSLLLIIEGERPARQHFYRWLFKDVNAVIGFFNRGLSRRL